MNGPLAQLVALTCHGNAALRGRSSGQFFPGNATCGFCDRITFVEVEAAGVRRPLERLVAETPDRWFEYLAARDTLGLRLIHRTQRDPAVPDRVSVAFAGGGGDWTIVTRSAKAADYWMARWDVWNKDAPARRIWRVTYGLVGSEPTPLPSARSQAVVLEAFTAALVRIHAFSERHDCGNFTRSFRQALDALSDGRPVGESPRDLFAAGTLSATSRAMLTAVGSAWVFGGMGSWNDMGFDGDDGKEYEAASNQLYTVLSEAICAAVNETDAG